MSHFRKAFTGTRTTAPTNVKGRFTPGTASAINFTASVQPVSGNDLESLPEGVREQGMYRLYTSFQLRTINQTTKEPADIIDFDGKKYKIVFLQPWQNNVINHYKAFMAETDDE